MVTRYNLAQLDMLADAGLDVLVVEDDIANTSALLISPAHFRRFVNPYNRRLVDRAHAAGVEGGPPQRRQPVAHSGHPDRIGI